MHEPRDGAPLDASGSRANERAPDGTALYVHLPFCAAKCHYCDFFSVAAQGHDRATMIDAILREARARAPRHPRTVFVGGGTPSLLGCDELTRLFDELERICGFRSSAREITVECNPESLDRDKARCLLDLGVDRLSIGFQSLDDRTLLLFGRVHSVEQSFRAYDAARTAGASNVNVDLIYAIPGQALEAWSRDLARVLALRPDHVSAYNLTFEEETLFRRWLDEGRLQRQAEELELEFFDTTRALLAQRSFDAYEISNFAQRGRACAHNVNYWLNGEYVGIGPSAASKVGFTRSGNVKGISTYTRAIVERGDACAWSETPDAAARLGETWWLGLRLSDGVDAVRARATAGFDDGDDPALATATRLCAQGLLERRGEHHRLSARGLPLADYVAREFLVSERA